MPARNSEATAGAAIASALASTHPRLELIFVDDASSDETLAIAKRFRDRRIKIIRNTNQAGVARSLNTGIKFAQGDLIARLDSDDLSRRDRFERQVGFLEKNKEHGLVGSWAKEFGTRNRILTGPTTDELIRMSLLIGNPLVHSSIMFRRTVFEQVGGEYSEQHDGAEDYELWTRFAFETKLAVIPRTLVRHRRHGRQVSVLNRGVQNALADQVRENYASKLGVSLPLDHTLPKIFAWYATVRGLTQFQRSKTPEDLLLLLKAIRAFKSQS